MHWLRRAVDAYDATFHGGEGLMGFAGDSHEVGHSCHFLIGRSLLESLGGWPVWYDHNFGDTELCQRAIKRGAYAKAPWALLYHDHPYWGGTDDDIYAAGRARASADELLYQERRQAGWPMIVPSGSAH
jgi:GT2 family glycosyltransferase